MFPLNLFHISSWSWGPYSFGLSLKGWITFLTASWWLYSGKHLLQFSKCLGPSIGMVPRDDDFKSWLWLLGYLFGQESYIHGLALSLAPAVGKNEVMTYHCRTYPIFQLCLRSESGYRTASIDRDYNTTAMDFLRPSGFLFLGQVLIHGLGFLVDKLTC